MKPVILSTFLFSLACANVSFAAQNCDGSITATTINSRYATKADGTVFDKQTGLTWMRCALGQIWSENGCKGLAQTYNWESARQTAANTSFAGQKDWRLPNQDEILTLLENRCYKPFINLVAFPNPTDNWFWTSTRNPSNMGSIFIVNFFDDYDSFGNKNDSYAVHLVRGEEL